MLVKSEVETGGNRKYFYISRLQLRVCHLRLLPTFVGVPRGKNCTRASFTKILANYISEESLIAAAYDKNIV